MVWVAIALLTWPCVAAIGAAAPQDPPQRIVLLLDGSLSMIVRNGSAAPSGGAEPPPTRFDVALDDLRAALEHLGAQASRLEFRVIAVGPKGSGTDQLWTFPREEARFATDADLGAAMDALEALRALGPQGTSRLGVALRGALALRPTRVLLYTDGMPLSTAAGNVPATQVAILDGLREWNGALPRIPIDVVGVGAAVAGAHDFLRTLAGDSGGYFVSTE